jgi:GntR family transcriptional regulator
MQDNDTMPEAADPAAPPAAARARRTPARAETAPAFSPLYRQIKALMVRGLQAGEWQPGQAIPSETELAVRFGVSQGTVRKAIDDMATDRLLVRRQGKGTFVATHAEQATQYRFLRLTRDGDGKPPALQRRLLECRRMRAPAEVARALALPAGETAVQVRRLLLVGAPDAWVPVVLEDIWLPGSLFRGLTAERLQAWRGPMYGLFETEFAVRMIRAEEKLRAVAAAPQDAALLGVEAGAPLLSVERLSYTYGDRPVELRRGLYQTGAHHYRNELN